MLRHHDAGDVVAETRGGAAQAAAVMAVGQDDEFHRVSRFWLASCCAYHSSPRTSFL